MERVAQVSLSIYQVMYIFHGMIDSDLSVAANTNLWF